MLGIGQEKSHPCLNSLPWKTKLAFGLRVLEWRFYDNSLKRIIAWGLVTDRAHLGRYEALISRVVVTID